MLYWIAWNSDDVGLVEELEGTSITNCGTLEVLAISLLNKTVGGEIRVLSFLMLVFKVLA